MAARSVSRAATRPFSVSWDKTVAVVTTAVIVFLVAVPLGVLLFSSFRDTRDKLPFEATSFTVANYVTVFTSESTYRPFLNTAWYAVGTLVIGIGLAMVFAWFLERGRVPFRSLLILMVLAPMATPAITDAMGWALLANPMTGFLNAAVLRPLLRMDGSGPLDVYSIPGMIFVSALKLVPSAYIMLSGPIARFDPSLEEASLTSRVPFFSTFRRITLPLLRPAVLAAFIYFLILVLELFDIPAVLGMPHRVFVFSTLIYDASHPPVGLPNYGRVSVYAVVFLALAAVLIVLYSYAVRHREQFSVITGRGYRAKLLDFGRFTWAIVGLIFLYFLLAVVLPFAMLVWSSLGLTYRAMDLGSLSSANFRAYQAVAAAPQIGHAVVNTIVVATVAATAAMVLATLAAWLSTRGTFRGAVIPDRLTIVGTATPSIVIALALIFFYVWVPVPIYGTIWIIVIGLSTRFLAYTTRLMSAAYLQLHKELEEASLACGVPWMQTIRRIVLPLIWPSFTRGWLYVLVHAMRDTTIGIMLFTVANDTVGVRLWVTWFVDGNVPEASAIGVCLAVVSIAVSFFVARQAMVESANV